MNKRVCPDCLGRCGQKLFAHERLIMRKISLPSDSTENPYHYETLPEWKSCLLCGGIGEIIYDPKGVAGFVAQGL